MAKLLRHDKAGKTAPLADAPVTVSAEAAGLCLAFGDYCIVLSLDDLIALERVKPRWLARSGQRLGSHSNSD